VGNGVFLLDMGMDWSIPQGHGVDPVNSKHSGQEWYGVRQWMWKMAIM
jgi:hypothetical protein